MTATRTPAHDDPARSARDGGAVLVWFMLLSVALLGVAALAVDLGYAYAVKRQLSSTADASALAGAQEAGRRFKDPAVLGCGGTLDGIVVAAVNSVHTNNQPVGSTGNPAVTVTCTNEAGSPATGMAASSVSVRVVETSSLRTFFGGFLGISTLQPRAEATARVFGGREQEGLRPFTICMNNEIAAIPARDKLFVSFYGQHNGTPAGCQPTGSPGNWGYASFDVGGSQSTLICLIQYGYNGDAGCTGDPQGIDLGVKDAWPGPGLDSLGNTGNSIQPHSSSILDDLIDKTIMLPAADYWAGTGANATYDGYGGIAVHFRGYIMPKPNGDIQVENYSTRCTSPVSPNTTTCRQMYLDSKSNWSNVSLVIFWDYADNWVSSYIGQNSSNQCILGSATCIPTLQLLK